MVKGLYVPPNVVSINLGGFHHPYGRDQVGDIAGRTLSLLHWSAAEPNRSVEKGGKRPKAVVQLTDAVGQMQWGGLLLTSPS